MVKQVFIGGAIVMVILLGFAVFATAEDASTLGVDSDADGVSDAVEEVVEAVAAPAEISEEVKVYVEEFVGKKGIGAEKVKNVSKVNFEDLPKEVNIENVNDANLAIYQVDYEEGEELLGEVVEDKQIFVITYSTTELREQGDLIIAHDKRQFLHFGLSGETESGFLDTATGVKSSLVKGYVMAREGSVTAITTNLEVVDEGAVEIIVYKNGEVIMFGNSIDGDLIGVAKDHDVQSKGVVTFEPGDVISAYVAVDGVVQDVITMVEITTVN